MWLISTNNMAFNTKELEIIKFGLEYGKSKEQVQEALANYRLGTTVTKQPQEQTFLQDAGQDIMQIGSDVKDTLSTGKTKLNEAMDAGVRGEQGALRTTFQQIGSGLGTAANLVGDVFKGVVKAVLPQKAETAIKGGIQSAVTPVLESEIAKNVISKYNSLDPALKRDIDAALGIGQFALEATGAGQTTKAVKQGGLFIGRQAQNVGKAITGEIDDIARTGGNILRKTQDVVEPMIGGVKQIPNRIATNIAEKKSLETTIKTLPTQVAQTAARNGIDPRDVKMVYNIADDYKPQVKDLLNSAKKLVAGEKVDPIEVVGKPITARISEMNKQATKIGQELGTIANDMGRVSSKEAQDFVFNSLKKVPGLQGITIGKNGTLNFANTTLATSLSTSERKTIQGIFNEAIKAGTGKQKHLLRQELFEILGGKKKGMQVLTDTQDKAYEAVRRGLSDLLDTKKASYKALNQKYAKTIQPISELRRMLKVGTKIGNDVINEDIIDMSAGLLARRLSSNAISSSQVRSILRQMGIEGQIDTLQDMYNILDRYYDLSRGTTLQKQVQLGVEKAGGIKGAIEETVRGLAGETPAVQRTALENIFAEILK